MTVSNVSNSTSAAASSTAASNQSVSEAQTNFLKLLVTQMKNQDPMNPMDNAQMTSQIAQLNTVSGINQLNTTVQSLASTLQASQALQASSLLGRNVLVAGDRVQLLQGQAVMAMDLARDADTVSVTIKDSAGKVVRTLPGGAQPAGAQNIFWDGATDAGASAADGNYSFEIQALHNGQPVTTTALSAGRVDSVSMAASGLTLSVAGLGNVALADVKQVR